MDIKLPLLYAIDLKVLKSPVQRVLQASEKIEGVVKPDGKDRYKIEAKDGRTILVVTTGGYVPKGTSHAIRYHGALDGEVHDLSNGQWLLHPSAPRNGEEPDFAKEIKRVQASWNGAFNYAAEESDRDTITLRSPQLGAVHAVHAHWAVSSDPATIVMPTGTGKTDTMLSILVSNPCSKLMVVVPTDALRSQLALKFLTLGILTVPRSIVLDAKAERPIVCTLEHSPRTADEVDEIFSRAQVIVTTSSLAGRCTVAVQDRMAHHCPYLFIDEAHHAEAPTWKAFKEKFQSCKVLQFTATPFREDGKSLDGKLIFKYPLRKAQEDGYFKPINFQRVMEYLPSKSDAAIAQAAISCLKKEKHMGHILMARVNSIARAEDVFKLYEPYTEFEPIQLHSRVTATERETLRQKLLSGRSRIVVCVDMLGEGFDLPELKIAAFHDIRKSLAVTLQLAGRFTRSREDLGNATFIANVADLDVQEELRKLYSMDPDWNALLPELSERLIGEEQSFQDYLHGFGNQLQNVSLRSLRPALSMVAYRTDGSVWQPQNFSKGIVGLDSFEGVEHDINTSENTLVVVTIRKAPLVWVDSEVLYNWVSDLYVLIWSPDQRLLFINGSSNKGDYRNLAEAVCGKGVRLIQGNESFRVFHNVERLRFQNVGLTEHLGRNVRYIGRMGSDVEQALLDLDKRHTTKSVLAGAGFEGGSQASRGASRKGRIWSHRRDRLDQLASWCRLMGSKLIDETIDTSAIIQGTLKVTYVAERPQQFILGVDWPETLYTDQESAWTVVVDGREYQLFEISIVPTSFSDTGPLGFKLLGEDWILEFEVKLFAEEENANYSVRMLSNRNVRIRRGSRSQEQGIETFFDLHPPRFSFADGSSLEGCEYAELRHTGPPYALEKLVPMDWTGIDITKESQGPERKEGTIQAEVIRVLKERGGYDVIMDDDGSGEAADVVTIKVLGGLTSPKGIEVELYHCKYAHGLEPGKRVSDLYEVCGQAQKSIHWMYSPEKSTDLMMHLLRRNDLRKNNHELDRIQFGELEVLQRINEISRSRRVVLKVFIVQPGLSKNNATADQLVLLAVTENYLWQTYQIPLEVITSA
ncbi:MAG: DEAD/DEAH box helicase family protein [Flavobacteriales bacterium]